MNFTRRAVVKGALLAAASTSAVMGRALAMPSASTIVYDSRLPQSRELVPAKKRLPELHVPLSDVARRAESDLRERAGGAAGGLKEL